MNHIDLTSVLRHTVVRSVLEPRHAPHRRRGARRHREAARRLGDRSLTVIDFSQVWMIDFSCADEVVAKLLMRYAAPTTAAAAGTRTSSSAA